tara:strand:- start:4810 stop:7287 length:2478 start_codon:yes stop_codon:yes gene_type:complete
MPNIRKSFHFREGVQVDDEVLVVRGSRVGIGTTVPDEALDVRGDAKVTGIATVNNIFSSGISTLTELRIGTGITVSSSSGIVSATKFVGDGSLLTSLPTSAWTSYGSTGIYTHSNVGVGTAFPTRDLQIGADPYAQSTLSGVGIGSDGNIKASGIVTASSFVGDITGDLTGEVNAGSLDTNANGVVVTGDLSVSGVSTVNDDVNFIGAASTIQFDKSDSSLDFNDNARIRLGNNSDIQIFHNSGDSYGYIRNSNVQPLRITGNLTQIRNSADTNNIADFQENLGVQLYHIGTKRLVTSGVGVTITSQLDVGNVVASSGYAGVSGITTVGISTTGITTTGGRLYTADDIKAGNGLEVTGVSTLGVSTFTGDVSFGSTVSFNDNSKATFGDGADLSIHHTGSDSIIKNTIGQLALQSPQWGVSGSGGQGYNIYCVAGAQIQLYYAGNEKLKTTENGVQITGITTSTGRVDVSVGGTAFTALPTGRVGVGTAIPGVDLQIKKPVSSTLELISDTGTSTISIGNSVGAGNSSAQIKFGNGSLEFFNKDLGSVNMYLHSGSAGVGTGRFDWLYGQGNDELMCLTHEKKLGIGITNPSNNLHVVGTSTITSHSYVGGNLHVDGTIYGTVNFPTILNSIQINNTSGLSTFHNVTIGNVGNISSIGINNNTPRVSIDAFSGHIMGGKLGIGTAHIKEETSLTVQGLTFFNHIGIGTTAEVSGSGSGTLPSEGLQAHDTTIGIKSCITRIEGNSTITTNESTLVGIGTTLPRAAVDFASAGDSTVLANARYMLPPTITTTQRNALSSVVAGAIIYNTVDNKLQCYNGSSWNNLF